MNGEDCVEFLRWALPRLGMRWAGFRKVRGQVCKRIARRVADLGLSGLADYRRLLEAGPAEWPVLDAFCRVTISRFHRDRGVFELIRDRLLPDLAAAEAGRAGTAGMPGAGASVRCWSAGCASGEEPFTLTILWRLHLQDRFPETRLHVLATDTDEHLLQRARTACYPASALRELPARWVDAAFSPVGGKRCLRRPFREGVDLRHQDIRSGLPAGPFHLILCRNLVFTYFEPVLQARLLTAVLDRLPRDGFLIIGAHEELPAGDWPLEGVGAGVPVFRRA
jgi:chemotaxis protein methyltransferase CheR